MVPGLVLTACQYSALANPPEQAIEVSLTVRSSLPQQPPDARAERLDETSAVVTGSIPVPNPCYSVAAQAQSHERTLTLSLIGTSSAEVCIQVLSSITYESTLTGLTAGAYDLIVVYEYPACDNGIVHTIAQAN